MSKKSKTQEWLEAKIKSRKFYCTKCGEEYIPRIFKRGSFNNETGAMEQEPELKDRCVGCDAYNFDVDP